MKLNKQSYILLIFYVKILLCIYIKKKDMDNLKMQLVIANKKKQTKFS